MIYHHLKALQQFTAIKNVYLVGKYDASKFADFIDDVLSVFDFKTIQVIQDDSSQNECGQLLKYRD